MVASFDPSIVGIFVFGLIAGICPCNSVICLGLIGYLTSGEHDLSLLNILKLVLAFSFGTILVLLPLGAIAAYLGEYTQFLSESVAWSIGGLLLIAMGLQLLGFYKPPIKSIFTKLKLPNFYSVLGAFLIGLSFGAITIGRGAPMLIIVLTYIALYQQPLQGVFTVLIYSIGLTIPLIIISSVGGSLGKKIKEKTKISGELADKIIGLSIILIGFYFIYLAF